MKREQTSPLFVRLPAASAERLSRAAFELKTPKRALVADLVDRYLGAEEVVVGRAATQIREPDVLTVEQLAELLQVDEKTVRTLASKGELPGRKLGRHWRFSRHAVLEWLANGERPRRRTAGFE
ncbi:MAG TPA: helix-turn-helix domain-containing protein [Gaiellaceae bacterium]|jgi:excisionase family DNA binding protein|nr:helix-turn-helix domain-containing protein [Gaiellaceae bacterium]